MNDSCTDAALAQSDAEPIARARYHLQAADLVLHDVEGDPFADHAHTLVHEAAFMITDDPELQALRKLPAKQDVEALVHKLADTAKKHLLWKGSLSAKEWSALKQNLALDLAAALAQSDAEPVAWRWRWRADPPNEWHFAVNEFHGEQIIIEPLFTGPPRPNTSAGLIEAAEWHEQMANSIRATIHATREYLGDDGEPIEDGAEAEVHEVAARHFRARAAARSGPDTSAGLNYVPVGGAGNGA